MKKAARNNVFIEISGRKGHSLANGLIAGLAEKTGATLVINSDTHAPGDLIDLDQARRIVLGAGLTDTHFTRMQEAAARFL
jgi:histidinol phosphatase-like PHP family hydrolase